jgi:raffinose/stachyose/melibiose transport system permease protein
MTKQLSEMDVLVPPRHSEAAVAPRSAARLSNGRRRRRNASWPRRAATTGLALVWLIIVAAPLYYMLVVSLERTDTFLSSNPWFPSLGVTTDNYVAVMESGFVNYLLNSLIVSVSATVLSVVVCLLGAYAVVVRASRLTGFVFRVFLTGFAVPIQALMVPLYIEIQKLNLYDSLLGLILPMAAFSLPVTVLILVNFLREVPPELIQAMQVDGAGPLRILWSLAIPISVPAIVTAGIFDFIANWNNFLFPLILTQSSSAATLPLSVFQFQGNHFADVPQIMASVALSALPLFVAYILARRRITSGLAAGFGK